MKLESVRALKEELLTLPAELVDIVARTGPFAAFALPRDIASRTLGAIALGVAMAKKQYCLAVRLQRSGPLVSAMTDVIKRRAKGEVDIQYVGNLVKFASPSTPAFYRQRLRPLRIGSSISDVQAGLVSAGTLGCFVARRQSPHYIGMLTNNHVIANENRNALGTHVVQPGTLDEDARPENLVGELGKFARLRRNATNEVDAAVADIYDDVDYDPRQLGNLGTLTEQGTVVDMPAGGTVHKVGRTSGQTKGRITAFDVDNVRIEYDMGVLRFDNQIEIEGTANRPFSDSGDSGSLIVDDALRAIGLLFAGGDEGGSNGKGLTYANPIETVLDQLEVEFEL